MVTYKGVPGFEGYQVGDDGTIWSNWNNKWGSADIWKQLSPGRNNKYGRQVVCLRTRRGSTRSIQLHRLILLAFRGPCPEGMEALHKNGEAGDNRLDNLEWGTPEKNDSDMRLHGRKKGERHHAAKLTDKLVREIRRRVSMGETHQAIADSLGVQRRNVGRIADRTRWTHVI